MSPESLPTISSQLRMPKEDIDLSNDKYNLVNIFKAKLYEINEESYKKLKKKNQDPILLEKEFLELRIITDDEPLHKTQIINDFNYKLLNRFPDILPYRFNIVDLADHQYINASFINIPYKRCFISTQHPDKNTLNDFYKMIIEKNVKLIIMLNAIQDNDKLVPYYKTEKVELLSETRYSSNLLFRKFTLKKKEIIQIQFLGWKDHSALVKSKYKDFLEIFNVIDSNLSDKVKSPIIIHCNAGVGRTGTFIAMYSIYYELYILNQNNICIWNAVRKLKEQRRLFVETDSQYKMIHKFVQYIFKKIILEKRIKSNII